MSNTAFSKTKINIKKSSWLKKSIIGASLLSALTVLGFGVYQAAGTDTPPVKQHRSSGAGHYEATPHLPVFAKKTKSSHSKKSLAAKKSKKHVVSKAKKANKKLAASKLKKHSKLASTSKHKKADLRKLSQKHSKNAKHSKHLAKSKKAKKGSKHLAAK